MEHLKGETETLRNTEMPEMTNRQVQRQMVWELHTQHFLSSRDIAEVIHVDRGWVNKTLQSLRKQASTPLMGEDKTE